jgi:hypothetical protein
MTFFRYRCHWVVWLQLPQIFIEQREAEHAASASVAQLGSGFADESLKIILNV